MDIEQLKRLLQNVIERYANKPEFFGEVRRDSMATDCLHAIKELEAENEKLKAQVSPIEELRHQKYKRCLAMAEWCDAEADVADADGDYEDMRWYQKWHERWLEIADKFTKKENG